MHTGVTLGWGRSYGARCSRSFASRAFRALAQDDNAGRRSRGENNEEEGERERA